MLADVVRAPPTPTDLSPLAIVVFLMGAMLVARWWLTRRRLADAARRDQVARAWNTPLAPRAYDPRFGSGVGMER